MIEKFLVSMAKKENFFCKIFSLLYLLKNLSIIKDMNKPKQENKDLQKFIIDCFETFIAFEHKITKSNKPAAWNFSTVSKNGDKQYVVHCTLQLEHSKALIKAALNQKPKNSRLVVICKEHTDADWDEADKMDYCLTTIKIIKKFGQQMLDLKNKDAKKIESKNHGKVIMKPIV